MSKKFRNFPVKYQDMSEKFLNFCVKYQESSIGFENLAYLQSIENKCNVRKSHKILSGKVAFIICRANGWKGLILLEKLTSSKRIRPFQPFALHIMKAAA